MARVSAESKVAQTVLGHLRDAIDNERTWKEKFHEYELMYLMKYKRADVTPDPSKTKQEKSTRSMQYVGYGHAQMETGGSKLHRMMFSIDPPFSVDPLANMTLDDAVNIKELHAHSFRKDEVKPKIRQALRYVLMYGVCPLKHSWEEKWIQKGQRIPTIVGYYSPDDPDTVIPPDLATPQIIAELGLIEKIEYIEQRTPYLVYAGPCTRIVDPYYFHIDPEAGSIEEARWVQEEFTRTESHVKEMIKAGVYDKINLDKVDFHRTGTSQVTGQAVDYRQRRREAANMPFDEAFGDSGQKDETQQGVYDLTEEWHDDRIITLIGRTNPRILRDRPANPFFHGRKPYTSLHYIKLPNEFWSIPMAKQLEGPQHELNMIRRLRSDALPSRIDPMWRMSSALQLRLGTNTLRYSPGRTIVAEKDELERLEQGELPIFSYKEEEIIRQDGDIMTGITDVVRGQAGATTTATVGSLNANFSTDRLEDIVDSLSCGMEEMLQMRHQLYGQFGKNEEVIYVTGQDGSRMVNLPIEIVQKECQFRFSAGREAARNQVDRNQFLQSMTIVSQNPPLMLRTNFDTLLHDFWLKMEAHDPGRYILAEGDQNIIAQFLFAQMMAAQQAKNANGTGGGGSGGKDSPKRASNPTVDNIGDLLSATNQGMAPKVTTPY